MLTRLTTVGGLYLVAVCLLPEMLISDYGLPFYFGGTSILIVVSVTMDTVTQIQSHLLAHQYEGLIRKARGPKGSDQRHEDFDPSSAPLAPGRARRLSGWSIAMVSRRSPRGTCCAPRSRRIRPSGARRRR